MNPSVILLFAGILFVHDLYGSGKPDPASVINPDGTLNLHTGFAGSLDLSASQVKFDPVNGPVLSPTMLTPDWYPLGPGLGPLGWVSGVFSIVILGNDVYAGGDFLDAGGNPDADYLARWDGCEWHAVGPGLNGTVLTIELNGGNVYIGGEFTAPFDHIGYWDGTQWNAMGPGLNATVESLASSGSDIYAGGLFTDAGGNTNGDYVAHWNGSSWLSLGPGLNNWVLDIEFDAGDVYVCGSFLNAGGNQDADAIARWDGTSWNNFGPAFTAGFGDPVMVELELDGNHVYIGGWWGPDNYAQMAYWDGIEWNSLGLGNAVAMLIYGNNIYVALPTSDCSWLRRYDINGQYWEDLPGDCFYTSAYAFAYNGIDLYAGGDFTYDGTICPECNIMRYGEPDNIPPLELNIPAEICQDDPSITLSTTQSGYTGEWSGDGVTNNVFDPSGLLGDITLTFTPDPGQCVSPADTFITVIDCAPPPCPYAGDDAYVLLCPWPCGYCSIQLSDYIPNFNWDGAWLPPINAWPPGGYYSPCAHGQGDFYYVVSEPGCPDDILVVTVEWTTWDPCGWPELFYAECISNGDPDNPSDDTILLTIPPIPGFHDGDSYSLITYGATILSGTGNYDLESTFLIVPDSCGDFCSYCLTVVDDDSGCSFGEVPGDFNFYTICFWTEACTCDNPPNAGENSSISVCSDAAPFDLTNALGGNPDPGGTWMPPLNSGNNTYNPTIDGSGTFTYTVSTPDCGNDQSTVTVALQSIVPASISGIPSTICETDSPLALSTIQNGITGNWSGTGISNNIFNPAGLNGSITITFTPDPNQCTTAASTSIDVNPFVFISITGIPDSVCQSAPSVSLPTMQTGINGNWSGSGVANNNFNPNGLSGNILLAFTPNANECANPASAIIYVSTAITPLISGIPDSLCQTDPSVNLPTTQSGITGIWSGTGITNNIFNPSGLNGNIPITFTVDGSQCANNVTISIQVDALITPTITGIPFTLCNNSPPLSLPTTQMSIIGNWTGQGVVNNEFNPTGWNGNITLTFTPVTGQCATFTTFNINVTTEIIPAITGIPDLLCEISPSILLPVNQNGIMGNWSGAGVSNNIFDPSGLNGNITITYTPDAGQCATNTVNIIMILQPSTPLISGIPSDMCETDAAILLPTIQENISGNWSGSGVMNNQFNPNGLSGFISILFTPDASQCANPTSTTIMVEMAITTIISGFPNQICQSANSIVLPITQGGIIGNWSGTGVVNNIFNPSGLNGNIDLSFTPAAGQCANGAVTSINVMPSILPAITGIPGALCETEGSILLSTIQNGIEGKWSGQGVLNNFFDPAGLNGSVQLTFIPDTGQCAIAVAVPIIVNIAPSFQNLVAICDSLSESYIVSFDITAGTPGTYLINGAPVTGSGFVSLPMDSDSTQYTFTLDDTFGCGPVIISGSKNCACATYSGTMNFNNAPLKVCAGSQFNVLHNGDQNLGTDDLIAFVLHDNAGIQLGTIYAISDTTIFTVPVGIILGLTYFLSAIAGSNDGSGNVDLLDGCLSVSQGIPIIFYQPDASISHGGNICQSDCFTYDVQFSGIKPFNLEYQLIANGLTYPQMIISDTNAVSLIICPSDYGVADGNMDIVLTNLADVNCDVALAPIAGTEIIVHPVVSTDYNSVLCDGEFVVINNTIYDQSNPAGIETFPAGSITGCDSIVQINLTYYPEVVFDLNETLCFGSDLIINGNVYNASKPVGTEKIIGAAFNGCDSTVNIHLVFDSIVASDLSLTLCAGESILINGTTYDESHPTGHELFKDGSALGCDSMVNVDLIFFPASSSAIRDTLCNGESLIINGNVYDSSHPEGTEILENANASGCDSTIYISLTYYPEVIVLVEDMLNVGDSLIINGTTYDQFNPSGIELIPHGSMHGCDSTIVVSLHFTSVTIVAQIEAIPPLCHGENTGSIIIASIAGGFPSYMVQLDTLNVVQVDAFPYSFTGLSSGAHMIWIQDLTGLADPIMLIVQIATPDHLNVDAGPDQSIKEGDDVMLNASSSFPIVTWSWWPFDFLSCVDCPDPIAVMPEHDIIYTLEVTDQNGCKASDAISILVEKENDIYFPTIFSPNGDGVNDILILHSNANIRVIKSLRIYDRWGDVISEQKNFLPNDPAYGWDGTFHGKKLNPGVFVWMAEAEFENGEMKIFFGDVTLVR